MEMESRPKVSALVDPSSLCVVVLYGFARVVCRRPRVFLNKYFDGQSHSKFRFQPSPSAILYAKKEKKSKRNSSKIENEPLRNFIVWPRVGLFRWGGCNPRHSELEKIDPRSPLCATTITSAFVT